MSKSVDETFGLARDATKGSRSIRYVQISYRKTESIWGEE